MELMTISEVSKNYNLSTRTLRYYEEIGLLKSKRRRITLIEYMMILL